MKRLPRWLWCLVVPGIVIAGHAIADQHSGWVAMGLNGLLYDWIAILILGSVLSRVRQPRRPIRAAITFAVFVYPVFWLFCLITALTSSWAWAIPASVVVTLAGVTFQDTVRRRRLQQPAAEPISA